MLFLRLACEMTVTFGFLALLYWVLALRLRSGWWGRSGWPFSRSKRLPISPRSSIPPCLPSAAVSDITSSVHVTTAEIISQEQFHQQEGTSSPPLQGACGQICRLAPLCPDFQPIHIPRPAVGRGQA